MTISKIHQDGTVSPLRDLSPEQSKFLAEMEWLAAKARRGELVGLAYVAIWQKKDWSSAMIGTAADECLPVVVAGTSRLQDQANKALETEPKCRSK